MSIYIVSDDANNQALVDFLTSIVENISDKETKSIYVAAIVDDNEAEEKNSIYAFYHNTNMMNLQLIKGSLENDITALLIRQNREYFLNILSEEE